MTKRTIYFIFIPLFALALVAGGGWWANQEGLLSQWLAPVAQTASSVSTGVQAQPGQGGQTGMMTSTLTSGNDRPDGRPAQPDGQAPPDGFPAPPDGQALAVDAVSGASDTSNGTGVAATAEAVTATATSAAATTAASRMVTIPAVAGVKGSQLFDDGGTLVTTLESGASVLVTGRSADSSWLSVTSDAGDGWVQAKQLIIYGLARLSVAETPAAVVAAAGNLATAAAAASDSSPITATGTLTAVTASTDAASETTLFAKVSTDQGRLNIRSGSGTDYAVVATGKDGATYTVLGRNDAGDWLELQLDGIEPGWASSAYLKVDGDVSQLPVRLAPAVQAHETEPAATTAADSTAAAIITVANSTTNAAADLQGTIVFQQSPGGMIYAYSLASGKLWQLTNGFDPAISPDGSTVAFVRDGGETGLYLIDIDGSNERRIFERSVLSSPKWSPDGQWIVFSRNDEGVDCYQMMPNYCMLPEEAKHRFPIGIPDSIPLVTEYQHKLSVVDSNGDNFHDVAALNSARAVDWSDAGIVYQSTAGIQITADGEDAVNKEVIFDNLNPYYFDPDLQPNGGQIVFQIKGAAQTDLWVVNADGTGKTSLTRPKTTLVDMLPSNVAAAYSPDGQHIVFLSNRAADNNAGDWHLWVMNADGSNQRQLPIDLAIDYTYGLDQVVSWGA